MRFKIFLRFAGLFVAGGTRQAVPLGFPPEGPQVGTGCGPLQQTEGQTLLPAVRLGETPRPPRPQPSCWTTRQNNLRGGCPEPHQNQHLRSPPRSTQKSAQAQELKGNWRYQRDEQLGNVEIFGYSNCETDTALASLAVVVWVDTLVKVSMEIIPSLSHLES